MTRFIQGLFVLVTAGWVAGAQAAEPSSPPARSTGRVPEVPQYPIPYVRPRIEAITRQLLAVKSRLLEVSTDSITTRPSADPVDTPTGRRFTMNSYAMGVVYSGMLNAADATGDTSFADFDAAKYQVFADAIAKVDLNQLDRHRGEVTYLLAPRSLDDCGSIGASMIKAHRAGIGPDLMLAINHIATYISEKQLRLPDGMLARPRPFHDSIWADDAYMSIPFLAQMGALTGDQKYFDDAAAQMLHFEHYLFVPSTGLFTHHYNTANPDYQPKYYWGRANGWCTMAMVELLDVLPQDHPRREELLRLLRSHMQALASCQAGDGMWHQLLDRTDSYTETSCTGMFVYSIARAVNRGWIDPGTYGPVAMAGWDGLSARIDDHGRVTGTCVGTSYADDYVYYYHRVETDDIHGYGPTLLAGSEIIHLLKNPQFRASGAEKTTPLMLLDHTAAIPQPQQ